MPLLKNDHYTSEDYWNLPEEERAELINGKFYDMAPPRNWFSLFQGLSGTILLITTDPAKFTLLPSPSTSTPMTRTGWNRISL